MNFLYFAHCASLLVKAGQRVASGDALAVMGNTGNAALADPPYRHCHLEVRAAAGGVDTEGMVRAEPALPTPIWHAVMRRLAKHSNC